MHNIEKWIYFQKSLYFTAFFRLSFILNRIIMMLKLLKGGNNFYVTQTAHRRFRPA